MLICLSCNDAVSKEACLLLQGGADDQDSALPNFAVTQHGSRLSVAPKWFKVLQVCTATPLARHAPITFTCWQNCSKSVLQAATPHAQTSKDCSFRWQLLNLKELIHYLCQADFVNHHASAWACEHVMTGVVLSYVLQCRGVAQPRVVITQDMQNQQITQDMQNQQRQFCTGLTRLPCQFSQGNPCQVR